MKTPNSLHSAAIPQKRRYTKVKRGLHNVVLHNVVALATWWPVRGQQTFNKTVASGSAVGGATTSHPATGRLWV